MSYILDALKKADQKRKVGMVPGLQTDHAALVNIEKRRRFSPLLVTLVAAVLLVNTALLLWWSKPWQNDMPHVIAPLSQPQQVASQVNESVRPHAQPGPDQGPPVVEDRIPPQNAVAPVAQTTPPPPVAAPAGPVSNEEVEAPVLSYPEEQPSAQTLSPNESGGGAGEPVTAVPLSEQGGRVMAQAELPNHILQALPQINISMHFFSNRPEARLVRINDRHLHEGDMVANDLRLLEITENGAIFSFRGYRFRVDKL